MFTRFRRKLQEREVERRRQEFERAAAESGPVGEGDPRARDLPDPLGDFNEMQRTGPGMLGGGSGGTGAGP